MGQSQNIAPPEDRVLLRSTLNGAGDSFSLQNVNTVPLPDGAMAYALDVKGLFVLDKTSTATAEAGRVVVPGSGPGRWLRFATSDAAGGGVALESSSTNTYATDGNYGTSTSAFFALSGDAADHVGWALTALGGILTYTGPTRPFMVTMASDVGVGNAGAPRIVGGAVSYNNDITGALGIAANQFRTTCEVAGDPYSFSAARRVVMASGDTLRAKFAVDAAAVALVAETTMLVIPV